MRSMLDVPLRTVAGDGTRLSISAHFERHFGALHRTVIVVRWGHRGRVLPWLMLNPSKAGQTVEAGGHADGLDPTLRRCMGFTRRYRPEADGFAVINLWSLVSTDPKGLADEGCSWDLPEQVREVGRWLGGSLANEVVVGWGTHKRPSARRRWEAYPGQVRPRLLCVGENRDNSPKHPLYVPYGPLRFWSGDDLGFPKVGGEAPRVEE